MSGWVVETVCRCRQNILFGRFAGEGMGERAITNNLTIEVYSVIEVMDRIPKVHGDEIKPLSGCYAFTSMS